MTAVERVEESRRWAIQASRAWLVGLQEEIRGSRSTLDAALAYHEAEIERIRRQSERCEQVLASLDGALARVEEIERRVGSSEEHEREGADKRSRERAGVSARRARPSKPAAPSTAAVEARSTTRRTEGARGGGRSARKS